MKMKNTLFLLIIVLTISCNEQKPTSFTINGSIEGLSSGKVFLQFADSKDTANIKNGDFIFVGSIVEPSLCQIIIEGFDNHKDFYLENSAIDFIASVDSIDKATISGSKTEEERISYNILLSKFDEKYNDIGNEYETADEDEDRKAELVKLNEQIEMEQVKAQKQFIEKNPSSYLCINIIWEIDWSFNSASEFNEYINILDTSLNNYKGLMDLKELVECMEKVEIGKIAPEFEINDIDGKLIRLSDSYSNSNYLLLDFWASSCGPCRKENMHIREAYDKFHDKGFDVIGVSTDTKKEMWASAIEKDGLTWTNVSNLKKWNDNEIVKMYALRQVSHNLLLDNKGKIIAKDLRGDNLIAKLNELID